MKNTENDEEGYLYCHISACAQLDYAQLHILTVDAYRVKYRLGEIKSLVKVGKSYLILQKFIKELYSKIN